MGGMLLCVDIGNTNTHYGLVAGGRAAHHQSDVATRALDDPALGLPQRIRELRGTGNAIDALAFCSVVPAATPRICRVAEEAGLPWWQLTHASRLGVRITYPEPAGIGQDRLANAAGAHALAGSPAVVIDLGTAVTFDIVTRSGGYEGGIIAPGPALVTRYLHERTAQLPLVEDLATPVMVLPAAIALTDAQAGWLAGYVAAGGTLVAEARLAILDDNGVVRSEGSPGRVLSEVFGLVERDVGPAGEFTWGGHRLPAPFLTQQLDLLSSAGGGARILAREAASGWPMVVENHYGQGRAVYFASVQGTAWRENLCAYAQQFFAGLFPSGHSRRVEKPEHVLVRWHENPATGDTLVYVMNFGDTEEEVRFADGRSLRVPPQGTRLVTASVWPTLPLDAAVRSPAFA
jgi:pantothenate kinase type III